MEDILRLTQSQIIDDAPSLAYPAESMRRLDEGTTERVSVDHCSGMSEAQNNFCENVRTSSPAEPLNNPALRRKRKLALAGTALALVGGLALATPANATASSARGKSQTAKAARSCERAATKRPKIKFERYHGSKNIYRLTFSVKALEKACNSYGKRLTTASVQVQKTPDSAYNNNFNEPFGIFTNKAKTMTDLSTPYAPCGKHGYDKDQVLVRYMVRTTWRPKGGKSQTTVRHPGKPINWCDPHSH